MPTVRIADTPPKPRPWQAWPAGLAAFAGSAWFAPVLLAVVALATFGPLLPWLGFYWDDWAKILVSRLFGLSRYFAYYAEDRPLSAWTHIVFTPLLGSRPLAWQVFALALRWLSAWGFYACLSMIWPAARRQNTAAALLFLVYPAFLQQPVAVTFFQQWLQYALFFFSLYAMFRSAVASARPYWLWTAVALAAMLLQLSVTEYFVPIELLRPLALWLLLANHSPGQPAVRQGIRAIRLWSPYLAGLAAYTAWRLFLIRLPGEDPYRANTLYDLLQNPLATLQQLAAVVWIDTGHILWDSWLDILSSSQFPTLTPFAILAYGIGLASALLVGLALARITDLAMGSPPRWTRQALLLGLAAVLLGPIPAWITGRQVVFDFHSDRYALPALFGASLLWVAGIEWIAQKRLQRMVLTGLLLTFAISLQLRTANDYRWTWLAQQRAYWQLAWRAPGLAPSTALYFEAEPFANQGLFSTSAAVNLLYPQPPGMPVDEGTGEPLLGYWVYTLSPRFDEAPPSFDLYHRTQFRTLKFIGNMSDSLLLYNDRRISHCLWVLSERDSRHPLLPDLVRAFLPISDTSRILFQETSGYPAVDLFGPEPEHSWCYFFEKADLARQAGDWGAVVRLGNEAQAASYRPGSSQSSSPYEWLPFIEGYARAGQWEQAAGLTAAAFQSDNRYAGMLCDLWESSAGSSGADRDSERESAWQSVQSTLGCQALTSAQK